MTIQGLSLELKAGRFMPVYIFDGEEPFFIDRALEMIINESLLENERDFNLNVLYGRDTDALTVISHAKRYPMMSERTVVIVREAQDLKDIELLSNYVKAPQSSTILALGIKGKKLDRRKALFKTLRNSSNAIHIEFKKIYENQISTWINTEAKALGLNMSDKASILLAESIGSDLSRIMQELEKLLGYLGNNNDVTSEVIEKVTGFSREFNNFELIKAIASKNLTKSYRIAKSMGENPKRNPIIVTISILFSSFSKSLIYSSIEDRNPKNISEKLKISEYALRDIALINQNYSRHKLIRIIGYLRDADRQAKGMGGLNLKDEIILNELLFKILY